MCNSLVFTKIHTIENSVQPTVFCIPYPCLLDRVHSEETRHLEINVNSSPVELPYSFLMKNRNAVFPSAGEALGLQTYAVETKCMRMARDQTGVES
jgi:hypothetical protein